MKRILQVFILAGAVTLTGCAARRPVTNWQLRSLTLVPPRPPAGKAIELANARSNKKKGPQCGVDGSQIDLTWRGRTAEVTIDTSVVALAGPVIASGGPMPLAGTPVRDQTWWTEFGGELQKREEAGCLGTGESDLLVKRIVENVAMPSIQAFHLRYGFFPRTGYLDLEPRFVLKSVAPVLKPGIVQYSGPADVAGYETAYYHAAGRKGGGVKLQLLSAERLMDRTVTKVKSPATIRLDLPETARYVRYFFREWRVAGDRKIALLATSRKDTLDSLTRRFESDPEGFCRTVSPAEASCIAIPREAVVTPETVLRLNGKSSSVIIAGTVGDAARAAGVKKQEDLLSTIQVSRPYEGRLLPVEFDRSRSDVLRLVLIGGEEVRW